LAEELEETRRGHGRLVEIVGPAGIGKTRLLDELRTVAGDDRVLTSMCDLYRSSVPFAPWRAVIRAILGVDDDGSDDVVIARLAEVVSDLAPDLEPWLPLLGLPLGVDVPSTPEVEQLDDRFRKTRVEET